MSSKTILNVHIQRKCLSFMHAQRELTYISCVHVSTHECSLFFYSPTHSWSFIYLDDRYLHSCADHMIEFVHKFYHMPRNVHYIVLVWGHFSHSGMKPVPSLGMEDMVLIKQYFKIRQWFMFKNMWSSP